ncbi:hypothetical protein [Paraburkholderia sp. J41]|uniref:hypothetical protein n=1 Tax=Paraburkholderia sp. J41 TaxID=2805433 RepID=UPI002AC320A5|nr:hypothetical protein [Paraburkholderia sp. J41]
MERYKNLGGDSNIVAYEISEGAIAVQYGDGSIYSYTAASPGARFVSEMQRLAIAGQGLNGYINRMVRKRYAEKLR